MFLHFQVIIRRHSNELKLFKESSQMEFESWRNNFKKQQEKCLAEKEIALREQCRKERDKEIEAVIERLENEASQNKLQQEQMTENRIKLEIFILIILFLENNLSIFRRIKEKYEKEIRDLESAENQAKNKYCEAKSKLLEYEERIMILKRNIKQLENQVQELKNVSIISEIENLY